MITSTVPSPLYRDPIYDGCADPTVIYHRTEKNWWMFYTQRRANQKVAGVAGSFGTKIGIAVSEDKGTTWIYRGTAKGLEIEWGHNTFWAPEVFYDKNSKKYRMLVTYVRGVPAKFSQPVGKYGIAHYESDNLYEWNFVNFMLNDNQMDIIDACIIEKPEGDYRIWYRDTKKDCAIYFIDTKDFQTYSAPEFAIPGKTEGPNVFYLSDTYYMIADPLGKRHGLSVYKSKDLKEWEYCGIILGELGKRYLDDSPGRHADVVVNKEVAYLFYFTQPYKDYEKKRNYNKIQDEEDICVAQCVKVTVKDGMLVCDRNEEFTMDLGGEEHEGI